MLNFPLFYPPFLKQIRTGLEHLFYLYGMKNELLFQFSSVMHSFVRLSVRLSVCLSVCISLSGCQLVSMFVCLFICLFVCLLKMLSYFVFMDLGFQVWI